MTEYSTDFFYDSSLLRRAAASERAAERHWSADLFMQAAGTIDRLRRQHREQADHIVALRTEVDRHRAETTTTTVEAAARTITAMGGKWTDRTPLFIAQALADAGLLATTPSTLATEDAIRRDERARCYREWITPDPALARGYWLIPCDDCQGTGRFPVPDGYDGDASCVRCKAQGEVPVAMAGEAAVLALLDSGEPR